MAVYSVKDIIGKHLITARPVIADWDYLGNAQKLNLLSGVDAGEVLTYVTDSGNNVWWQFSMIDKNTFQERFYYIKQLPGVFDESALQNQNVKSDSQKQENINKETQGFEYYLQTYGVPAFVIIGGIAVVKQFIKSKNNGQ